MIAATASICYRFGRFELQPDERRLLATGTPVHVGPHAFDLLTALVERSGHLVTKDELFERVWPKLVVEENTLQVHISALRKVLGSGSIATISGRGYRFTPEVTRLHATSTPPIPTPKHNLPHELTSFIGREKEIAELKQLLSKTRLLTLTGAGGCGKTRLAIQGAADVAPAYPDGVWLVEFAALVDPGLVPQMVANALAIAEQPAKSLIETIAESLASRHLLLVLDNAEHVLGACAQLADALLRRCEQLVILVTSRERLGIAGELIYRVPSLSVPGPERDATPEQISGCESARLFIERARLQLPHFAVTVQSAAALASICRRLDGIALAIELAAPRVRSMSMEELSRHLDQRFGLLTGGSRTALPRHRTLRSLIDWSYDFLSEAEKAMLRRASVFSGGWTLEAAQQVCSGERVNAEVTLDLLTSLADKNLVAAETLGGATRYGLLETVRHYARDRLREHGEEAHVELQHFAYFLSIAEDARRGHRGANQKAWLDRLESESDNLRAALSWSSTAGGDAAGGLQLAGSLSWFWFVRGYLVEGRDWLSGLLATTSKNGQATAAHATAYQGIAMLAGLQCDPSAAKESLEKSLAIWKELGSRPQISHVLTSLGSVIQFQGDHAAARPLFEEALAMGRESGDLVAIAVSLGNLGALITEEGDYATACLLLEESLGAARELGDPAIIAVELYYLGNLALAQGDYRSAQTLLHESLTIQREMGNQGSVCIALARLGRVAQLEGDDPTAQVLLKEALTIQREQGYAGNIAESLEAIAPVACTLAGACPAARIWGQAERMREETGAPLAPCELPLYNRQVAAARAALGDDAAFDQAWQEGRMMNRGKAMQYALDVGCSVD
jgi:predicted ATPase/DNA-binding winged helix-turn-helix (wHTH) protein/Tfp pilus assembly protein PilF